uniref:E3 ubiquitin-protein ligase n=1 Tax=Anopheles atroparvus TaxID=41427 RepID=A0A182JMN5_ANOAO
MADGYLIVWERFTSLLETWTPYSAEVSRLLDRALLKCLTRAELGDADPALIKFHVNFLDMKEFGPKTAASVRRMVYPANAPTIVGITWEFCGDNWYNFPFLMQKHIEMSFLRGVPRFTVMLPESGAIYLIDLEISRLIFEARRTSHAIRRLKSVPYAISKTDPNASSIPRTIPAVVPEGWRIADAAPEQQLCEQMHQMHLGQLEEATNQMTVEEQATGEELDPVRSLAKRFSNFFLGKSSDAPSTSSSLQGHQQCQAQVQQQLQGAMSLPASMPHGPPVLSDEPGFSGAAGLRTVGSALETVNKPLLSIGTELNVTHNHLLPEAIKAHAFAAGYLKLINPVPIWMQPCPVCQLEMLWGDDEILIDYPVAFGRCQHVVHMYCFMRIVQQTPSERYNELGYYVECPTCHVIYGRKIGCQPHGTMEYAVKQYHLPGHEDSNTIEIMYNFQSSVQNQHQPRPGKEYFAVGFPRRCFLPNNNQGRLILTYLLEAFNRRILFTIGRSATTGIEDVVQPCVEHKTKVEQFPDHPFFQRVIQQLVNLGVAD